MGGCLKLNLPPLIFVLRVLAVCFRGNTSHEGLATGLVHLGLLTGVWWRLWILAKS